MDIMPNGTSEDFEQARANITRSVSRRHSSAALHYTHVYMIAYVLTFLQ